MSALKYLLIVDLGNVVVCESHTFSNPECEFLCSLCLKNSIPRGYSASATLALSTQGNAETGLYHGKHLTSISASHLIQYNVLSYGVDSIVCQT